MELFALWYRYSDEGRRIVEGWQQRALLAAAGMLAGYVLLRLRAAQRKRDGKRSAWGAACRFVVGGILAAGLWLAVDLLRDENFLGELWAALPPQHENAVKALLLVGCGWAGWSVSLAEFFPWIAATKRWTCAGDENACDGR